jgi:hypothetical protein
MPWKAEGLVAEWFKQTYKGLATFQETLTTVGVTRIQILNNNPERASVVFVNPSADFITITPSTLIAAGSGIRMAPNGGFISMTLENDVPLPAMAWYAVGDAAALSVYTLECIRVAIPDLESE